MLTKVSKNKDLKELDETFPNFLHRLPSEYEFEIDESLFKIEDLVDFKKKIEALDYHGPKFIFSEKSLKILKFKSPLTELPKCICKITEVKHLIISENRLQTLPDELGDLTALESLYLYENAISNLPVSFTKLSRLSSLWLHNNLLRALPEDLDKLFTLDFLDLDKNQLSILPESIGNLSNLTHLSLHQNRLNNLPEGIGNLSNLKFLVLSNNRFSTVPTCIYQLNSRCSVNLTGNPLTEEAIANLRTRVASPDYHGPQIVFSATGLEKRFVTFRSLEEYLRIWCGRGYPKELLKLPKFDQNNIVHWLSRLKESKDFSINPVKLQMKIKDLLVWINDCSTEERAIPLVIIAGASDTCGDGAARIVNELSICKKIAQSSSLSLIELSELIIGKKRYEILNAIAERKCESLKAVDPIEVYLCYETRLKNVLKLPLEIDEMLFERYSSVTDLDLEQAKTEVLEKTSLLEQKLEILAQDPYWKKALEKQPDFESEKNRCEEAKQKWMESIDTTDPKAESHNDEFKINDMTIWNPYYLITQRILK